MVLLGLAVVVATLLTPMRRHLRTRWPWIGLGIAALLVAPNLVWQVAHGWPSLEFYHNADVFKNVTTPPQRVLALQVLFMNPGTLPLWAAGLVFLVANRTRSLRQLGWVGVVLLVMLMAAQKSRPDRIAGIYPLLFAAGAVWFERWTLERRRWLRPLLVVWLALWAVALAPIGMPLLSPERLGRYVAAVGIVPQIEAGPGKTAELPQWFADRFGWESFASDVARVAARLDPDERAAAVIFAPSYGQAGALELYGRSDDLPPVYSSHNNYYLWGPPERPFSTAIVVGDSEERLSELFEEVELAAVHECDPCMRWRDEMPIWVARHPRKGLEMATIWRESKHFE